MLHTLNQHSAQTLKVHEESNWTMSRSFGCGLHDLNFVRVIFNFGPFLVSFAVVYAMFSCRQVQLSLFLQHIFNHDSSKEAMGFYMMTSIEEYTSFFFMFVMFCFCFVFVFVFVCFVLFCFVLFLFCFCFCFCFGGFILDKVLSELFHCTKMMRQAINILKWYFNFNSYIGWAPSEALKPSLCGGFAVQLLVFNVRFKNFKILWFNSFFWKSVPLRYCSGEKGLFVQIQSSWVVKITFGVVETR